MNFIEKNWLSASKLGTMCTAFIIIRVNTKFVNFKCGDIHTSNVYSKQNNDNSKLYTIGERQCKLKKKFFLFDMIKINFFQTYFNSLLIELEKRLCLFIRIKRL